MPVYINLYAGNMYVKKQGFWCTKLMHKITKLKSISLSHTPSSEKLTEDPFTYLTQTCLINRSWAVQAIIKSYYI